MLVEVTRKKGPGILNYRKEESEELFSVLEKILEDGDNENLVRTLEFEPGTLSIFSGSTSLHEVNNNPQCTSFQRMFYNVEH